MIINGFGNKVFPFAKEFLFEDEDGEEIEDENGLIYVIKLDNFIYIQKEK